MHCFCRFFMLKDYVVIPNTFDRRWKRMRFTCRYHVSMLHETWSTTLRVTPQHFAPSIPIMAVRPECTMSMNVDSVKLRTSGSQAELHWSEDEVEVWERSRVTPTRPWRRLLVIQRVIKFGLYQSLFSVRHIRFQRDRVEQFECVFVIYNDWR